MATKKIGNHSVFRITDSKFLTPFVAGDRTMGSIVTVLGKHQIIILLRLTATQEVDASAKGQPGIRHWANDHC
jgi:hypothetical protein